MWISTGGCSRLARNRLLGLSCWLAIAAVLGKEGIEFVPGLIFTNVKTLSHPLDGLKAVGSVRGMGSSRMLDFPHLPFDRMGEADVREDILAPLIRELGYRTGTEFDIIREQSLRYPKVFFGRKNPKKDVELRGKADYILEVQGQVR